MGPSKLRTYRRVECVVREDLDDDEGDFEGEPPLRLVPPRQRLLSPLHWHVRELADVGELAGDAESPTESQRAHLGAQDPEHDVHQHHRLPNASSDQLRDL